MPKVKKRRVGVRIDMTPMVDVAFLLLTFFMLTTQFKPPEEVSVILPDSHSEIKLPQSDVLTITVSKEGQLYMGLDPAEMQRLFPGVKTASVRVPIDQLSNNILRARGNNPKLRFVIKGDKDAEYGPVLDVMDVFQKGNVTRFNLVTNFET